MFFRSVRASLFSKLAGEQLDRIAHGYRYNFSSDALEELTDIVRMEPVDDEGQRAAPRLVPRRADHAELLR